MNDRVFIEVRGLNKRFGRQHVLRGVDLTVYRGETLVLIGPSGEGKTVLMKHLRRPAQTGRRAACSWTAVSVIGLRERQLAPVRKKFGFLFQNAALFDAMTVGGKRRLPARGVRRAATVPRLKRRVHDALAVVDLEEHKTKLPCESLRRNEKARRHRPLRRRQSAVRALRRADRQP